MINSTINYQTLLYKGPTMAVSPKAVSTPPKTDGGNPLAALLAAAAASMHRQQQQQIQQEQQSGKNKTNYKSTNISIDKDFSPAAKLLIKLCSGSMNNNNININNGTTTSNSSSSKSTLTTAATPAPVTQGTTKPVTIMENGIDVKLRNLETWHDEDEEALDDSCYQELVDPSNSNGWSADEMFKYNEKMHKITSSYNEKTLSRNYTTPLRKINSKATMRIASQLAKEIEERVTAEGRITPESSDDDELFENERLRRIKQQKNNHHRSNRLTTNGSNINEVASNLICSNNNGTSTSKTTKSSSHYSNSTETPATVSLSSSPTLNDIIIKPVTSSSRNILRTCLT